MPLEAVSPVLLIDLAANIAIWVLLAVQVIERGLKVKCPAAVHAKLHRKSRIPHKQVTVKRRIEIRRNEAVFGRWA